MLEFVLIAVVGGLLYAMVPWAIVASFETLTEETAKRSGDPGPMPTEQEIEHFNQKGD